MIFGELTISLWHHNLKCIKTDISRICLSVLHVFFFVWNSNKCIFKICIPINSIMQRTKAPQLEERLKKTFLFIFIKTVNRPVKLFHKGVSSQTGWFLFGFFSFNWLLSSWWLIDSLVFTFLVHLTGNTTYKDKMWRTLPSCTSVIYPLDHTYCQSYIKHCRVCTTVSNRYRLTLAFILWLNLPFIILYNCLKDCCCG